MDYDTMHNMETYYNINKSSIDHKIETIYKNIINNKCKTHNCLDEIIYLKQKITYNNTINWGAERKISFMQYYLDENFNLIKRQYHSYE